ncbi:MAG TPA: hypothetical protein VNQ90_00010 [Chthoniobacteraceae bacterium]|nr:hypothetical protein [Chthoniobacteraceae bacterium]
MNPHPQSYLASIARECKTKRKLAACLKGAELKEAWRIKQIQNSRRKCRETGILNGIGFGGHDADYGFMSYYMVPKGLTDFEREKIKPEFRDQCQRWPLAWVFEYGFEKRVVNRIMEGWCYSWRDKEYRLSVRHDRNAVSVNGSRSASSYVTYYVTLAFDLLRQEAVWIGGLLTIRAKEDYGKSEYPCRWLERRKDGPGFVIFSGRITGGDHHEEDEAIAKRRRLATRLKRVKTVPPKGSGWVTRQTSLDAGNCAPGTDNFIRNRLVPYFQNRGCTVGNLTGLAVRFSLVLELERTGFAKRMEKMA